MISSFFSFFLLLFYFSFTSKPSINWCRLSLSSVIHLLIAERTIFLEPLLVLIVFLMAEILILTSLLEGSLMAEFLLIIWLSALGFLSYRVISVKWEDMIHGVNYASAAAGIIYSSGSELGQRISLSQQIQQFTDTFQSFIINLGEDATADLISSSVFYVSIGINDYIHYYLRSVSNVQNMYLPWSFSQFLATTLRHELKHLYSMSVRKIVVMGLAPIGCAPHYLMRYSSKNGECITEINDMILKFNFYMRYMIDELSQELPQAKIIFCDLYEGSMDIIKNYQLYGFNVTTDACFESYLVGSVSSD